MTTTTPSDSFNPFEPGYAEWPYDQFNRLRAAGPVLPSPFGGWQLYSYDDCFRLLRIPGTSVDDANISGDNLLSSARNTVAEEMGLEGPARTLLFLDPPDHTRIRRLVSRVFTPRAIEKLRGEAQQITDDLLADIGPGDRFDCIAALAFPLPFQVISHMLGIPEGDTAQLREWSHTLAGTLEPIFDAAQAKATVEAATGMQGHLMDVIAWRRQNPGDDLLTGMIATAEDGDELTDDELLSQILLLFIAGHETTVNLIGNGMLQLLRHPDQWHRLHNDPALVPNAVEECLRFDPPVQMTRRITMEPFDAHGTRIEPGTFVMTMTAAANRDPAHWGADADDFDIGRDGANHHLSFGSGIHHCLGAALARMEGQVAIGTLVARHPALALAGEPVHNGRFVLRGLDELPLTG